MKKKKGFTLVELIAVITILGIVILMITVGVTDAMKKARIETNKDYVRGIAQTAEIYYTKYSEETDIKSNTNMLDIIEYSGRKPDSGYVYFDKKGYVSVGAVYDHVCYVQEFNTNEIIEKDESECNLVMPGDDGANVPVLNDYLIPVTIDDNGNAFVADSSNTDWYNYNEKKWANAVMITGSTPAIGQIIPASQITQMFVWIPRYKYVMNGYYDDYVEIQMVSTIEKNVHNAFRIKNDDGSITELPGIWVGKFEFSEDKKTLPNVNSINNKSVSELYNAVKSINPSGTNNIHMIKNTEWGAVTYLTYSNYGSCLNNDCPWEPVSLNGIYDENTLDITTGCGNNESIPVNNGVCPNNQKWNTSIGTKASTTSNTSGIYDLSGGRFEYVMGVQYDLDDNLTVLNSGFKQLELSNIAKGFIDEYEYDDSSFCNYRYIEGDATAEILGFVDNACVFVNDEYPWFARGTSAYYDYRSIWDFAPNDGSANIEYTTRAVIFPE